MIYLHLLRIVFLQPCVLVHLAVDELHGHTFLNLHGVINGIEKLTGLTSIISKYDDVKQEHKFSEQALNGMVLIKLTAENFCCRSHQVDEDNIDLPE